MSSRNRKKAISGAGLLILALALVVWAFLELRAPGPGEPHVPRAQAEERESPGCCEIPETNQAALPRSPKSGGKTGPLTLTEHKVDDPHQLFGNPQERELRKLMSLSLRRISARLPALEYRGEMTMSLPRLKRGPERFGANETLESSFVFQKDGRGNYRLRQETHCSEKNSRYAHQAYTGTLYRVDGRYYYYDAEGREVKGPGLKEILRRLQGDGEEPLVRRNWLQLLRDLNRDLKFKSENGAALDEAPAYTLSTNSNQAQTGGNLQIHRFMGRLELLTPDERKVPDAYPGKIPLMKSGVLQGASQLGFGYMQGAETQFNIRLELRELKQKELVQLP